MGGQRTTDESASVAGLADPTDERSNCGVGVVMDLNGGTDHDVVADGLELLENLEHRGTTGAESNTGDGAGILFQMPHDFFASELDVSLPSQGEYAVGSFFLPRDDNEAAEGLKDLVESELEAEGLDVFHWRTVPTNDDSLGATAAESEPRVEQAFVTANGEVSDE